MKIDEEVLERVAGLAQAVIRVGDGRGFVVGRRKQRFVLTAAHCLPKLPPAHPMSHTKERTYQALLGPLGAEPTVWAECLFADPVADIAILSGPDNQALFDQAEAYEEFLDDKVPLAIGDAPKQWRKQVASTPPTRAASASCARLSSPWAVVTARRRWRPCSRSGI